MLFYHPGYGMQILAAAILGVIQGLTEFLPISSSAHLILVPWFLGWKPEGLAFDVALHVGTAVAVLAYFWKDWMRLAGEALAGLKRRNPCATQPAKLFWLLAVGTLPALVAGLALEKTVEARLRSPLVIVLTLAGLAVLLFLAERKSRLNRSIEAYTWSDAVWIGLCQAAALIPGVSRSGVTMTAALYRNSDRSSAARFSFLLSTPVIVGAGMLQGWRLAESALHPGAAAVPINWAALGAGTAVAAVTGFFCIGFFLRYLRTNTFTPFVLYRIIFAAIILVYYLKYF
jgi:undecaprenyl-diphosphatase